MKKTATAVAFALLLPTCVSAPNARMTQAKDWRAIARLDVRAAYDLYAENHPGAHDPANPAFLQLLARARDAGLKVADSVHDSAGYSDALGAFSAELSDGHAAAFATVPSAPPTMRGEWPGFVAGWRGDHAIVQHAGPASPAPTGSTIVSCDGMPAADVIHQRLRYAYFLPAEAGQWWWRAPAAFVAGPGTERTRPQRCTFRLPSGDTREATLTWTPAPADIDVLKRHSSDGERTPIGLSEPRAGVFLVGMPDFAPDTAGVNAYRALYDALRMRRPELLRARAVVLDMRYNNGGSSEWSLDVARLLWGKDEVDRRRDIYGHDVRVRWRASRANIDYMSEMERRVRENGQADLANSIQASARGMKAALAKGEAFYEEDAPERAAVLSGMPAALDFTRPVYVITSGRCASACLDAVDTFKLFANVKLIGAPTSADSTYIDVRMATLPSGEGEIVIPMKMYVHRPRGSGEVYWPAIQMLDADWSTASFLDRIEQDLKADGAVL